MMKIEEFCRVVVPTISKLEKFDKAFPDMPEDTDADRVIFIGFDSREVFEILDKQEMLEYLPSIMNNLFLEENDVVLIIPQFDTAFHLIEYLYSIGLSLAKREKLSDHRLEVGKLTVCIGDEHFINKYEALSNGVMGQLVPDCAARAEFGHKIFEKIVDKARSYIPFVLPFANSEMIIENSDGDINADDPLINYSTGYSGQLGYYRVNKVLANSFGVEPFVVNSLDESRLKFNEVLEGVHEVFDFGETFLSDESNKLLSEVLNDYQFLK
jgi:hypothetical protein